jgi:hypothetical protein
MIRKGITIGIQSKPVNVQSLNYIKITCILWAWKQWKSEWNEVSDFSQELIMGFRYTRFRFEKWWSLSPLHSQIHIEAKLLILFKSCSNPMLNTCFVFFILHWRRIYSGFKRVLISKFLFALIKRYYKSLWKWIESYWASILVNTFFKFLACTATEVFPSFKLLFRNLFPELFRMGQTSSRKHFQFIPTNF